MPIIGQIQPNYLHPHVATYINDNTEFQDSAAGVKDDNVKMMYVITSPRGRDNVFLTHKNQYDWLEEYGNPKIDLYGQAGYMAYNSLSTGLCTVKTMRVMPEDATYANALIALKVKVDETLPEAKKLLVKHTCSYNESAKTTSDLLVALEALRVTEPDEHGYVTIPVMAIQSIGRGVYGNEYRVRISQSSQMDRENDYKNIKIETLGTEKGLKSLGFFEGAIHPEALSGKRSINIQDFINDVTTGSKHINIHLDPAAVIEFTELYAKVNPEAANAEIMDIFGFLDKLQKPLPSIEVQEDSVLLDTVEGIPLSGGDDGEFKTGQEGTTRQEAINKMLIKAFKGEIDRAILSRRRVPADVLLDAAYDADVKRSLIDLAVTRNSSMLYIDAGNITTVTQAVDWAEEMKDISPWLLSKNVQCYKVRDPFTYRPITVSITYHYATAIPAHFKNRGRYIPFAGPDVTVTNMIPGTLLPVIDSDDRELKESLYEKRVNFIECVSENVFQRGAQTTAQNIWSDLSEEHNVHELFDIKQTIEDYAATTIYNFAEVEDRNRFTEDARMIFANRIGTHLRAFNVRFEMNAWEEERSILHCYIEIIFKTIAKRVIVEIDINKRV